MNIFLIALVFFIALKIVGVSTLASLFWAIVVLCLWPVVVTGIFVVAMAMWAVILFIVGLIALAAAKAVSVFPSKR